jgi:hypothetical protein
MVLLARRKTNEEFVKEVYDLVGDEYEFLEEYKNNKTKIKCRHNQCKYKWKVLPVNFLKGTRCPKCMRKYVAKLKTKTHKQFEKEVDDLTSGEYTVISQYTHSNQKVTMLHNACGYKWDILPNSFTSGTRCPICMIKLQGINNRVTSEEYRHRVYNLVDDEYSVISDYKTSMEKVELHHHICGRNYWVEPHSFLKGHRCPYCAQRGQPQKSHSSFIKDVKEVFDLREYTFLSKYNGATEYITIKHNPCAYIFKMMPNNFIKSKGCPSCNSSSKGEMQVHNILQKFNVAFKKEFVFEDCRYKYPLPFDFAILNPNCRSELLIEYDGEQHFKPVNFGGISDKDAQNNFKRTQHNDQIKNQYCKDNNIPLLRIPYWEFDNIESILEEWLTEQGVLKQ